MMCDNGSTHGDADRPLPVHPCSQTTARRSPTWLAGCCPGDLDTQIPVVLVTFEVRRRSDQFYDGPACKGRSSIGNPSPCSFDEPLKL